MSHEVPEEVITVDVPGHPPRSPVPPSNPWLGRERLAGLSLVVFGLLALWAGSDLPFMTEGGVGSGLLPRALAIIITLLGVVQMKVDSWFRRFPQPGSAVADAPAATAATPAPETR